MDNSKKSVRFSISNSGESKSCFENCDSSNYNMSNCMENHVSEFCNTFNFTTRSNQYNKLKYTTINRSLLLNRSTVQQKVSVCKLNIYELADFGKNFTCYNIY